VGEVRADKGRGAAMQGRVGGIVCAPDKVGGRLKRTEGRGGGVWRGVGGGVVGGLLGFLFLFLLNNLAPFLFSWEQKAFFHRSVSV